MNANTNILKTAAGRHFHLFGDCSALETGRRNSEKYGREIHAEWLAPLSEALEDGMFACRACFKRAGEAIPAEADRVAIYAQRAAVRLAKKMTAQAVSEAPMAEIAPVTNSTVAVAFSDGMAATKSVQKSVTEQVRLALMPLFASPFNINVTMEPMAV